MKEKLDDKTKVIDRLQGEVKELKNQQQDQVKVGSK